jgi:hypothetical protein
MSVQVKVHMPEMAHIDIDGEGSDDSESPRAVRKTKLVKLSLYLTTKLEFTIFAPFCPSFGAPIEVVKGQNTTSYKVGRPSKGGKG